MQATSQSFNSKPQDNTAPTLVAVDANGRTVRRTVASIAGGSTDKVYAVVAQGGGVVVLDNMQFRIPPGNEGRALQMATTDVPNTVTTRSLNYFQNNNSTTVGVRYVINTGFQYFAPQNFTFNTDGDLQEIFIFNESTGKTYRVTALFAHVSAAPNKIAVCIERIGG